MPEPSHNRIEREWESLTSPYTRRILKEQVLSAKEKRVLDAFLDHDYDGAEGLFRSQRAKITRAVRGMARNVLLINEHPELLSPLLRFKEEQLSTKEQQITSRSGFLRVMSDYVLIDWCHQKVQSELSEKLVSQYLALIDTVQDRDQVNALHHYTELLVRVLELVSERTKNQG